MVVRDNNGSFRSFLGHWFDSDIWREPVVESVVEFVLGLLVRMGRLSCSVSGSCGLIEGSQRDHMW